MVPEIKLINFGLIKAKLEFPQHSKIGLIKGIGSQMIGFSVCCFRAVLAGFRELEAISGWIVILLWDQHGWWVVKINFVLGPRIDERPERRSTKHPGLVSKENQKVIWGIRAFWKVFWLSLADWPRMKRKSIKLFHFELWAVTCHEQCLSNFDLAFFKQIWSVTMNNF